MSSAPQTPIHYDRLLRDNRGRVLSERDAGRRIAAIRERYADDAMLYEPETGPKGHAAIGHHGIGRLRWQGGPPNGPVIVAGMDIARVECGRIHSHHVFLDPAV